ncbi:hypothetical protein C8F01DRAFT_1146881 [Mycena amicta]|nr:hypothetical protein C8F01DRAFT_1146881 [Mycena amicta]
MDTLSSIDATPIPDATTRNLIPPPSREDLNSFTETGVIIEEAFSGLLILESLARCRDDEATHGLWTNLLFPGETPRRTWNFFIGPQVGDTDLYPDDIDTTSYALRVLPTSADVVHSVLDDMLALAEAHPDAIIPVYFPTSTTNAQRRNSVDPVVCINALRCFAHHRRFAEPRLAGTKTYILGVLGEASFMQDGTRYYSSPDALLFFAAGLLAELHPESIMGAGMEAEDSELEDAGRAFRTAAFPLLQHLLSQRQCRDVSVDSLSLAMRILAFRTVNLPVEPALVHALESQAQKDDVGWLCRYGRSGVRLGNRYLTRVLVLEALSVGLSP